MPERHVLIHLKGERVDDHSGAAYHEGMRAAQAQVPGSLGTSLWRRVDQADVFLLVLRYADEDAAARGLTKAAEIPLWAEQDAGTAPAHVVTADVLRAAGAFEGGAALTYSVRLAGSGRGTELAEEAVELLDGLAYFEGFCGGFVDKNVRLDEEILTLATWESPLDYRASMPEMPPYEVVAYSRLG